MPDPIDTLCARFSAALAAAFGDDVAEADPQVRVSDRADYQSNAALSLSKRLRKPPRQIAEAVVARLDLDDICDTVEIAGPGFINVVLKNEYIAAQLGSQLADARLGVPATPSPEKVVIDYSAPNVAKEMHVGHLRSTIIGDALARLLSFRGHFVVRHNHIGDWGTPFGMLIEHLVDLGEDTSVDLAVEDLNAFYREAREKFDDDPVFADRARQRVVELQAHDARTIALWQRLVDESKRHFSQLYDALRVTLTDGDIRGESFYNEALPEVVQELQEKNLLKENDGALCVFLPGYANRDGDPLPLIVRKSDGGYGYATTDLAAIRFRTQQLGATRILYVVGAPQRQHLSMIFDAAMKAGWLASPARAEHVQFGSVLGSDGKMFKTRAGETVKLATLIQEGLDRAHAEVTRRFPDLDAETAGTVSRQVGVGAFKYADLSNDRVKDYTFDLDRMVQFEGNSAGYVQYAHARCRSILRKADAEVVDSAIRIEHPVERALGLQLLRFGSVVEQVETSLTPHTLCTYLFDVASTLSSFWSACPVLKSELATRDARLALVLLTARVLDKGLDLVGIEAPERM